MNPYMKLTVIFGTITAGGLVFYGMILPYEKTPLMFTALILLGYCSIGLPSLLSYHFDKKEIVP